MLTERDGIPKQIPNSAIRRALKKRLQTFDPDSHLISLQRSVMHNKVLKTELDSLEGKTIKNLLSLADPKLYSKRYNKLRAGNKANVLTEVSSVDSVLPIIESKISMKTTEEEEKKGPLNKVLTNKGNRPSGKRNENEKDIFINLIAEMSPENVARFYNNLKNSNGLFVKRI